ncbi:MAG: hypothetical protein V3S39_04765, partial [Thermodesulfobacteriota bacterium]
DRKRLLFVHHAEGAGHPAAAGIQKRRIAACPCCEALRHGGVGNRFGVTIVATSQALRDEIRKKWSLSDSELSSARG